MSIEQKNENILNRFESKVSTGTTKVFTGLIDGKRVIRIGTITKTDGRAAKSFCDKFGAERFGGLV